MKRSRFSEEQIISVLREQQAGIPVAEVCRKHGVSEATFYNWRSRYGGMEVSDARRLKSLEEENRKLKKLLAESALDNATLKEMLTVRRQIIWDRMRPLLMEASAHLGCQFKRSLAGAASGGVRWSCA